MSTGTHSAKAASDPPVELTGLYQHLDRAIKRWADSMALQLYSRAPSSSSTSISGKRHCCRLRSRELNRHFRICCCLKAANLGFRLTMSRKSQTTSLRCNTMFAGSLAASLFRFGSYARFTRSCCVVDAGQIEHLASSAIHKTASEELVQAMLFLFRLRRNN